jgi:hypothetical protein
LGHGLQLKVKTMNRPASNQKIGGSAWEQEFAILRATANSIAHSAPELISQHQATIAASLNRLAESAGLSTPNGLPVSAEAPRSREQSPGLKELLQWLDGQEIEYVVTTEHDIGAPRVGHYGRAAKLLRFFHSEWASLKDEIENLEVELGKLPCAGVAISSSIPDHPTNGG